MKRTPLHGEHVALGAKMVPFAGWEMPIQYTSVLDEHMTVRSRCGLFDVSHMGDLVVRGAGAGELVGRLMTNDVVNAPLGRCVYSHILREDGAILDDTIVTPIGPEEFLMVPNAATTEKMLGWVGRHARGQVVLNLSDSLATIAIQGPGAEDAVKGLTTADLTGLRSFWAVFAALDRIAGGGKDASCPLLRNRQMVNAGAEGVPALISRTGYTGEDGFEIVCENDAATTVWRALMEKGVDAGVRPVGLGARDTLRLEKGLLLSGTDFDGTQTTLQTGPRWVLDWNHDFIGRHALEQQRTAGGYPVLVGIVLKDKGIPRHGYGIVSDDKEIGVVTSGTLSPVLRVGIALGYVPPELSSPGTALEVRIREKLVRAHVAETPFVRRTQK
ncbi:MAG: glycine cleavage system aminomethyltransferase GcvT [Thermoplasmata archaeon]